MSSGPTRNRLSSRRAGVPPAFDPASRPIARVDHAGDGQEARRKAGETPAPPHSRWPRLCVHLAGVRALVLILALAIAVPQQAADRQRIATINVAATSLFTYLGCVVQKKVKSWRDAGRCFAAGAVAGAGFYQAKRLAADGHITRAWIVANASTSVVENTTSGEHPLSRLGYTFGPLRLRVVTPFDRAQESLVDLDLSAVELGYLVRTVVDADDVDIRDGMIWWETRERLVEDDRTFTGYTWGIYPGLWQHARDSTRNHEAVHAIQSLQVDSVDPPIFTEERGRKLIRIRHFRLGALNFSDNLFHGTRPYHERWGEIEAYRFADDIEPPR